MLKEKFTISPFYELLVDEEAEQTQYVLFHKVNSNAMVVNPAIFSFLNIFKTPNSLNEAIDYFAKETQSLRKDVKPIVMEFFDSMMDREILMHENAYKEITARPQMPNAEGQQWFGYHLTKRISDDPPVDIYLAEKADGTRYIIKRIQFAPDFPEKYTRKELQDFQHEFKILQKLRGCTGICQLIENNKKENYAAIEYFQGYSLRKRIEDMEPKLTLDEKRHIFTQILKTMAFMHERGILHGDFHYSNILLNDDLTVKVIDFDLALHISERQKVGLMRGGVKDFLPPERIEMNAFEVFNDPPDFPAEVFQIGVIGYFLFFENLPFEGDTWKKMARAIIHDEPDYTRVDIPANITTFLKKSLEKKPENRFNSAIEMYQNWLRIDV